MNKTLFTVLVVLYVICNIATFIAYAIDKRKAQKGAWRIPEKTLLCMAFFGGAVGGILGMEVLRYKTKHVQFKIVVPLSLVIQICLWAILVIKFI